MRRADLFRIAWFAVPIVLVRVVLYRDSPLILTGDSWDFLGAANGIADRLDFSNRAECGLRDCRLPGYPLLLAGFRPFTRSISDRILILQALLGLLSVGLGVVIGVALRSRRIAEGLALFLGIDPVYLINEHALMSEGLSLVTLLAFVLLLILAQRDGPSAIRGAWIGLSVGAAALVRVNALPFCAGSVVMGLVLMLAGRPRPNLRMMVRYVLAMAIVFGAVVAPWLYRNYTIYHRVSFVLFQNRPLLVYRGLHPCFDPDLPLFRKVQAAVKRPDLDYDWLQELTNQRGTHGAETTAGALLAEQWRHRSIAHVKDMMFNVVCFAGIYETSGNDRAPMLHWFEQVVGRPGAVRRDFPRYESLAEDLEFRFTDRGGESPSSRWWRSLGRSYLIWIRPLLFLAFVLAVFAGAPRGLQGRSASLGEAVLACLATGYFAVAGFHAVTFTDSDRFASLYDWAAVLVVLLALRERGFQRSRAI